MESMDTIVNPKAKSLNWLIRHRPRRFQPLSNASLTPQCSHSYASMTMAMVCISIRGLYAEQRYFWIHRNYPQPLVNKIIHGR